METSSNNFGFGFNDAKFSDRTLLIEIIPDPDPVHDNPKRRRVDSNSTDILGCEAEHRNGNWFKTVHISTIILAAKSPFFYKLFSNGMSESNQQNVTLRIQESEEVAFMELLKFIYTDTLSSTTRSDLVLDVLLAADKYEVASCMKYCLELLQKMPMTCESASLYLDLSSTMLMDETVRRLIEAAKDFLVACFNDIRRFQKDMLNLPLVGVEAVLSSDNLQVPSEDSIYNFVMKWAQTHYTKLDERQEILVTRLLPLIRFPFMSCPKLEEVLNCSEINLEVSSKLVVHGLSAKIPHLPLPSVKERERAYKLRPVKLTQFDVPHEECVVYLDLTHEECVRLVPNEQIYSQNFPWQGQMFYLLGLCSSVKSFGLYLGMKEGSSTGIVVEYEFSYRMKPSEEFVVLIKTECAFAPGIAHGCPKLFGVPWDTFIADDCPYFINGVLHLRAVLKIKKQVFNKGS